MTKNCIILTPTDEFFHEICVLYTKALTALGYKVNLLDMQSSAFGAELVPALQAEPHFVLSFEGDGSLLSMHPDKSIYEAFNLPLITLYPKPPKRFPHITSDTGKMVFIGFSDKYGTSCAEKYIDPHGNYFYIPNPGFLRDEPHTELHARPIDVFFCDSIPNPEESRKNWNNNSNLAVVCESMTDIMFADEHKLPVDAFLQVMQSYGVDCDELNKDFFMYALMLTSEYMRGTRNIRLLSNLAKNNVKFHCLISEKHALFADYGNVIYHTASRFSDYLRMFGESKIVVNTCGMSRCALGETLPSAMLNSAVAASDTNEYIDKLFTDNRDFLSFSHNSDNYGNIADKIKETLARPAVLQEISENGRNIISNGHTARHWAERIVKTAYIARLLYN